MAVAALVALVAVAHTLTPAQRNAEVATHPVVWYYLVEFIATMLLVAVALALWTAAAVAAARRLDLPRPVLCAEAVLAAGAAVAMVVMTAGTAVWWGSIASSAPWFLQGTRVESAGSPLNAQLVGTMVLMLVASVLAGYGVSRVARSWPQLRSGAT